MSSSDDSFGWKGATARTMSSSEDDAASIVSSVLDRKLHKNKLKELIRSTTENDVKGQKEDAISKKKKRKSKDANSSSVQIEEVNQLENIPIKHELDDDLFVKPNKKIKAESVDNGETTNHVKKSKVKRKHNSEDIYVEQIKKEESDNGSTNKKKRKRKAEEDEVDTELKLEEGEEPPAKKKRKRNKETTKESNSLEENLITNIGSVENDIVSSEVQSKKKKHSVSNIAQVNGFSEDEINALPNANERYSPTKMETGILKSHKKEKRKSLSESKDILSSPVSVKDVETKVPSTRKDKTQSSSTSADDDSPPPSKSRINKNERKSYPLTNSSNKERINLSERINFEDDINDSIESETDILVQEKPQNNSNKLNKFIECNPSLKQVFSVESGVIIGKNDDVWIVKCPNDLNHKSLKNMVLSIENKLKVKVDGQTYDGVLNEDNHRAAVLLPSSNGKFEVKDFSPKGTLTFRRRIPKVDLETVNVAIPPPSFIPLPETKKRHPLFGPDYRKQIKIPAEVAERLADKAPKKKHKLKKKQLDESFEVINGNAEKEIDEVDGEKKKKKKRKRKHSESGEEVNIKKVKRDPEVWDSEKAIENSLFNF